MALPLEDELYKELGMSFDRKNMQWNEGSGSCGEIKDRLLKKLPQVIDQAAKGGKEISDFFHQYAELLQSISRVEGKFALRETYQAIANVIRDHVSAYHLGKDERLAHFERGLRSIFQEHLVKLCEKEKERAALLKEQESKGQLRDKYEINAAENNAREAGFWEGRFKQTDEFRERAAGRK